MEIWAEVPGYNGWYEASNQGRVRSWRRPGKPSERAPHPHVLSPAATRGGYLFVGLSLDGRTWQARLNRLVLIAFIGPPFEGAHACHRNGDNQDNRLENLYWGTAKENAQDKKRCGTHATGEKVNRSKLKRKQVAEMKELHAGGGWTYDRLGEKYRVNGSTVWRAINGKTWEEG